MTAEIIMHPAVPVVRAEEAPAELPAVILCRPNVLLTRKQVDVLLEAARRRGLTPDATLASLAAEALASAEMVAAVLGDGK